MPRITALEPQKRRPGRVSVFVDGEFTAGMSADVARTLDLAVGRELAEGELERVAFAAEVDGAYARALNYLRPRRRSRYELARRLKRYGYGDEVVEAAARLLSERGLVDDKAFADAWVRDRVRLKPKGRRALRAELAAKGVGVDDAEAALAESVEETEEELARRALAPRADALRSRGEGRGRAAALSFLARRGFAANVARRVANEIFSA